jgi:predicted  nucleic acid-binding Zn-ribbon protein
MKGLSVFQLFLVVIFIGFQSAQAQEQKQTSDPMVRELLNEVRLLRKTLQQINLNTYRSQIIIERLKVQREAVAQTTRLLEKTHSDITDFKESIPRILERGKLVEEMIVKETDGAKRLQIEFENKILKRQVEQMNTRIEQLQNCETQLVSQLSSEQSKLDELEKRLDDIEREMEDEVKKQKTNLKTVNSETNPVLLLFRLISLRDCIKNRLDLEERQGRIRFHD